MKILVFNSETNLPVGEVEVPQDVLEAAARVEQWMKAHRCIALHGLTLANDE